MRTSHAAPVEILPGRGLDNEESVRHTNGKVGRSTIRKHRTDDKTKSIQLFITSNKLVQTEVAR